MRFSFVKSIFRGLDALVARRGRIDEDLFDELEDTLIRADVSVRMVTAVLDRLRARSRQERWSDPAQVRDALKAELQNALASAPMQGGTLARADTPPTVFLFVGVNGTGKTTTIAKVAYRLMAAGSRVLMAAGDTFRAAAIEQLETWATRLGCEVVRHRPGSDPSAVVFDAIHAARARGADYVLADTAGRIHTKTHLMEELKKVARVTQRELGRPADEILLVLDATTGQNGISQARLFTEAVPVSGIVLAKLDGTARGGIVVSIADELRLPIKLVGCGEKPEDLEDFEPAAFVEALLA